MISFYLFREVKHCMFLSIVHFLYMTIKLNITDSFSNLKFILTNFYSNLMQLVNEEISLLIQHV
jgi:hypothetical protein